MTYIIFLMQKQQKSAEKVAEQHPIETDQEDFAYKIQEYDSNSLLEQFAFMIVRPPRFVYNKKLLIPANILDHRYSYRVHKIPFPLSIYKPKKHHMKYIILYLHGNSSSRFQGFMMLDKLPLDVGLACFDFNGCGLRRQANYITLGKNQSEQVTMAAKYLKKQGYTVVGWGRSMGSVALLMSKQCDIMIADSPFCSLKKLCQEFGKTIVPKICCGLFHCFYPCVQCLVNRQIYRLSGLSIQQLQVSSAVQEIPPNKAILFMLGNQDQLINPTHIQKLFESYQGKNKKMMYFQGGHNSDRPLQVLKQCFQFIAQQLNIYTDLSYLQKTFQIRIFKPTSNSIRLQQLQRPILSDKPTFQKLSLDKKNSPLTPRSENISSQASYRSEGDVNKQISENQLLEENKIKKSDMLHEKIEEIHFPKNCLVKDPYEQSDHSLFQNNRLQQDYLRQYKANQIKLRDVKIQFQQSKQYVNKK